MAGDDAGTFTPGPSVLIIFARQVAAGYKEMAIIGFPLSIVHNQCGKVPYIIIGVCCWSAVGPFLTG
jgi:hypothetical protein